MIDKSQCASLPLLRLRTNFVLGASMESLWRVTMREAGMMWTSPKLLLCLIRRRRTDAKARTFENEQMGSRDTCSKGDITNVWNEIAAA